MKHENPFGQAHIISKSQRGEMCGRKAEIEAFTGFMATINSQPKKHYFQNVPSIWISGIRGSGKTTLLNRYYFDAEKNRMLSLYVKMEKNEGEKDLAEKLWFEVERIAQDNEIRLAQHKTSSLEEVLRWLSGRLGGGYLYFGAIIIIDDLDKMRNCTHAVRVLFNLAKNMVGKTGFVFGSTSVIKVPEETIKLELSNLNEHDSKELLENVVRGTEIRIGPEFFSAIMNDSNGNPKIILSCCSEVYNRLKDDQKLMTRSLYQSALPGIMSKLSRDWFGKMYSETPKAERQILHAMAEKEWTVQISDIAREVSRPLGQVTALTKRLLDSGQIVKIARGEYAVFSKLYGRYVVKRSI